jgi:hypothetical protein
MNDNEKQFEDFVRDIKFNDTPDPEHRDKLEQDLVAAFQKQPRHINIWRTIMKSRITKLAAAAIILIGISVIGWLSTSPDTPETMSSFALLSKACAAEQTLFYSTSGIAYIANEIVLYPQQELDASELLTDLESDVTSEKNIALMKSWFSYRWIPVYSLRADGRLCVHKLKLAMQADEAVTVSDLAWYESATGRFVRVLRTGSQVIFANAFDGESIYLVLMRPKSGLQIEQQTVTGDFKVPDNPADFLGISAGIRGSVPREQFPPIQNVTTGTSEDGTLTRVYKLGFADPWGKVDTYYLYKINTETDVITEIRCVVEDKTSSIHRRLVTKTVDSPEFSWNLAEISEEQMGGTGVKIEADEGASIVTAKQMAKRATSAVYLFAKNPPWTYEHEIYDLPDEMIPDARFFSINYNAKDGRDVVLTQGETFNRYFAAVFKKFKEIREPVSWMYESENGFKVLHQRDRGDKKGEMWWTEFALKSSGFEPAANRVGYILQSPAGTYLVLAINGPVSRQELQSLIDSLVPAEKFVSIPAHP